MHTAIVSKECFKCSLVKSITEFYRHNRMADGHLNKCKECTKRDSTANRWKNIEKIRAYDRDRGNRQSPEYSRKYYKENPHKVRAQLRARRAIKAGKLARQPCQECGTTERIEAHHTDYSKPLDVMWLCSAHHKQWHVKHGPVD